MEVLDFINTHADWEEILTRPPYCIKVKRDGDYILLKYNQLSSDFSFEIVRECRGSIFYQEQNGKYICVCRAFDKFGNYGESYVKDIDWNSAVVEEKVDGSLVKVWYHNNQWHVSTNGTIDAYKAEVADNEVTFGNLFDESLSFMKDAYLNELNKNMTYMFELVSPISKVTIYYPKTKLYYLGQRDMKTMIEYKNLNSEFHSSYFVDYPKVYKLNSLAGCLEYLKTMTKDEEGFVIRDKNFNRMKLKSPEYLLAFHLNNNGAITTRRIINMIKNEQIDDFLAYCPEYKDRVEKVINAIIKVSMQLELSWDEASIFSCCKRKEFAKCIKDFQNKDFIFLRYDNPKLTAMDYIMKKPTKQIKKMIIGGA